MRVLILGGNAAGMSAASRLVRKRKDVSVTVVERSKEVSYGACGLPYYIGGFNDDIDLMRIRKPEKFRKVGVDLNLMLSAEHVDIENKSVDCFDLESQTHRTLSYDKLIIATGSAPIVPNIEGSDLPGVHTLKTLEDGEIIRSALQNENIREIAVVGGGYIGLELCEAFSAMGRKVTLFEAMPNLLNGFDSEFGQCVAKELEENGITVYTNDLVKKIEKIDGRLRVISAQSSHIVDMIIFAVGVKPNTSFLPDQISKLPNGAIITNERMETSVRDIYAAGDCSTVFHKILKKPQYIPLGTNANKQGRIVADVIMGNHAEFAGALGTAKIRVLSLELGKTGITENEACAAGIDAGSVRVTSNSHAPYYPNPVPITLKLCYDKPSKRILGAQIVGREGAASRIDVLALAVDQGVVAEQLRIVDFGYAPPFSTVWDVIHIAANAIK